MTPPPTPLTPPRPPLKSNAATGSDTAQVDTETGFGSGIRLQPSPVVVVENNHRLTLRLTIATDTSDDTQATGDTTTDITAHTAGATSQVRCCNWQ